MSVGRSFQNTSLLFSKKEFTKFKNSKVGIIGLGGVGSWAAEALVRSGLKKIVLIDPDNIFESNINRQSQAYKSTLGLPKVSAISKILIDINPDLQINHHETFFSEENANLITELEKADFWIDACDDLKAKTSLILDFFNTPNKNYFLVCGGAGGKTDPLSVVQCDLSETMQDPLLAKLRYKLRKNYGFPRKGKMKIPCISSSQNIKKNISQKTTKLSCSGYGSIVTVTATMGLVAASYTIKKLTQQE